MWACTDSGFSPPEKVLSVGSWVAHDIRPRASRVYGPPSHATAAVRIKQQITLHVCSVLLRVTC
jgi:hypothetical protein